MDAIRGMYGVEASTENRKLISFFVLQHDMENPSLKEAI